MQPVLTSRRGGYEGFMRRERRGCGSHRDLWLEGTKYGNSGSSVALGITRWLTAFLAWGPAEGTTAEGGGRGGGLRSGRRLGRC